MNFDVLSDGGVEVGPFFTCGSFLHPDFQRWRSESCDAMFFRRSQSLNQDRHDGVFVVGVHGVNISDHDDKVHY